MKEDQFVVYEVYRKVHVHLERKLGSLCRRVFLHIKLGYFPRAGRREIEPYGLIRKSMIRRRL